MKARLLTIAFLLFSMVAFAQQKTFHYNEVVEKEWNYAQVYRSGNLLFLSGVTAKGTMEESVTHVYRILQMTLDKYGLDKTHVVKEGLFTRDMEAMKKAQPIRKKFYGDHSPASTWVQIDRLFEENYMLEVEWIVEIEKQ
ncbi:MAG: RidA family protein [Algoriphagus aquaeductus]|uniref:RidA family protein n=1 Tax=Algoriphagus aquaeductus TaxID=475299 RepID=UPI00391A2119